MDLSFVARFLPSLLEGTLVTLELSVLAIAAALILGMVIALAALSGRKALTLSAGAFVQSMRNTPLLVQLYLVYFGLGMIGLGLSAFVSGLIALTAQNSAYIAEIYRGGLQSVSIRQFEAGRALGMRRSTLYTTVILPQVIARVVPPLTNQSISIIKDTSQVAAIAVMEIMKITEVWVETSANTYDVFLGAALIYLALTSIAGLIGKLAERRLAFAQ